MPWLCEEKASTPLVYASPTVLLEFRGALV